MYSRNYFSVATLAALMHAPVRGQEGLGQSSDSSAGSVGFDGNGQGINDSLLQPPAGFEVVPYEFVTLDCMGKTDKVSTAPGDKTFDDSEKIDGMLPVSARPNTIRTCNSILQVGSFEFVRSF